MSQPDPPDASSLTPIQIVRPVIPPFAELRADLEAIFASGVLTKGPYVAAFEQAVAERLHVRHVIAVSSCTSALALTYRGLNLHGPVIVPSFTFMATVSALIWAGAVPRFVDVDPRTTNLDPTAVRAALTPDIQAIVAVHNYGAPAAIGELQTIADGAGIPLIFDAAHAFGATYRQQPIGGWGTAECFSLSPTKLVIAGEGGIVATNDAELASRVRVLREYGNDGHYGSTRPGLNARMPEFNAAIGSHSLHQLDQALNNRQNYVAYYRQRLGGLPGITFQHIDPADRSSNKDITISIDAAAFGLDRDSVHQGLQAVGIDTRRYYDPPVHRHVAYRGYTLPTDDLPYTDQLAARVLSLPLSSHMDEATLDVVCGAIERLHATATHGAKLM